MLTVNSIIDLHCTHTKLQTQTLIATLTVNAPLMDFFLLQIGQFDDDRHGSRLRTLISHYTPAQVSTFKSFPMGTFLVKR